MSEPVKAVLLPVGDDLYAVEAARVREVIADPVPTTLPLAPGWVRGLVNLRGEVVPLVDTAAVLQLAGTPEPTFAVVAYTAAGPAAFSATAMPEFVTLEGDLGTSGSAATISRHRIGDRLVVVLDVEALLASGRGEVVPVSAESP